MALQAELRIGCDVTRASRAEDRMCRHAASGARYRMCRRAQGGSTHACNCRRGRSAISQKLGNYILLNDCCLSGLYGFIVHFCVMIIIVFQVVMGLMTIPACYVVTGNRKLSKLFVRHVI